MSSRLGLEIVSLLLERGADPNRGNDYGWTKLHQAGYSNDASSLGREPLNLRVAAGLGDSELVRDLAGTSRAGAHRGFYRPHGGFPAWQPTDDPQEVLDEALVWAAKSDDAIRLLVELGADPLITDNLHGGNALGWARVGCHEELADILP